jgi:ATP-dependent RNA helicase DHX37/DHR1
MLLTVAEQEEIDQDIAIIFILLQFSTIPDFPVPEIFKVLVEGIILLLKYMGINKVANFPFPTPPDRTALVEAERCLKALSVLDQATGMLMPVGEAMTLYPISPRHSRMLLTVLEIVSNLKGW